MAEVRFGRSVDVVLVWKVQKASQGWWIWRQSKGQEPGGVVRLQVWCVGGMEPAGLAAGRPGSRS